MRSSHRQWITVAAIIAFFVLIAALAWWAPWR